MTSRTWIRKALAFSLALVFLNAGATFVLAGGAVREQDAIGQLTITGRVTVNGLPAATGDIVASGSTVQTAKGSSAVVSLGKLGRVELLPDSKMKLRFDDSSISISLGSGRVRVSTGPGVAATITRDE
jgi:ferric-dicitrate binding protein FerR (iron transport regulator)